MAHTPGPWQVERSHGTWFVTQGDAPGSPVSLLQMNGPCVMYSNAEEDARLIAAAPDLLEALVMVRDADDDDMRDGGSGLPWPARGRINRAIAKAEGRS